MGFYSCPVLSTQQGKLVEGDSDDGIGSIGKMLDKREDIEGALNKLINRVGKVLKDFVINSGLGTGSSRKDMESEPL